MNITLSNRYVKYRNLTLLGIHHDSTAWSKTLFLVSGMKIYPILKSLICAILKLLRGLGKMTPSTFDKIVFFVVLEKVTHIKRLFL